MKFNGGKNLFLCQLKFGCLAKDIFKLFSKLQTFFLRLPVLSNFCAVAAQHPQLF